MLGFYVDFSKESDDENRTNLMLINDNPLYYPLTRCLSIILTIDYHTILSDRLHLRGDRFFAVV